MTVGSERTAGADTEEPALVFLVDRTPEESRENRIGVVHQPNRYWDRAAIALDLEAREIDQTRSFLEKKGRIVGIQRAMHRTLVFKVGARTKHSDGVVAFSGPSAVVIERLAGRPKYDLSNKGDSGAVWACTREDGNHVVVALHRGGRDGVASCKPTPEVAKVLDLDVL